MDNFSQHAFHPKATDPIACNWVFLIDTLNFCFWTPGDDTKWQVNGSTGYFALCAAIKRAIDNGTDITNPRFYATITLGQLEAILEGDDASTRCPLLAERVECLHQVGTLLLDKYNGDFVNCVKAAGGSAQRLLAQVVDEFPCYRDEATFNGERVSIYKRAQILVGDLWSCYRGQGLGHFDDIDAITMFADYRVPQVLVHFGCLEYSDELLAILRTDVIMANGCAEEVEIRGASIHAVELLKAQVRSEVRLHHPQLAGASSVVNSILLDHFLWDYRRRFAKELEHIPFHKTISVYY